MLWMLLMLGAGRSIGTVRPQEISKSLAVYDVARGTLRKNDLPFVPQKRENAL